MKPNFALTLSLEGIRLLQRAPSGWLLVGEVGFDAEDLPSALSNLREAAERIAPGQLACKLVIPNEQIKFMTVASTARTEEAAEEDAAYALEGATPYKLNELAFDWSLDDGQLFIAAVARETLAEAEAFAQKHAFKPVSFVALPEQNAFPGEPFFGATKAAKANLSPSEIIARDLQPIAVIGKADIPPAPPEPTTTPEPAIAPEPHPEPEALTPSASDAGQTAEEKETSEPSIDAPPIMSFSSVRANRSDPAPTPPSPVFAHKSAADSDEDKAADIDSITAPSVPLTLPIDPTDAEGDEPQLDTATTPATADQPAFMSRRGDPKSSGPDDATQGGIEPKPSAPVQEQADTDAQADVVARPKVAMIPPAPDDLPSTVTETAPQPVTESQRMTVFGQRKPDKAANIGGKPKYLGLALTAALVLFMVAAGIWATVFNSSAVTHLFGSEPEQIELAEPIVDPNSATEEELAEAEDVEPAGEVSPDLSEGQAVLLPDAPAPLPQEEPRVLTPEEAERRYIASGIWQVAPQQPTIPEMEREADAYLVSVDPQVRTVDAIALPDLSKQHDGPPNEQLSPTAPGTTFDVDTRGLVKATPDGAMTSDGIRIFAGRPPVYPRTLPERATDGLSPDELAALAAIRPRARPDNLQEARERSQLGGRTLSELSKIRPKARPDWVGQSTDDQETSDDAQLLTGNPLAVAQSLRPKGRPDNFARLVAKTKETAQTQVAAAAPAIPSSASVARQATVKNALNLRKLNLIGVSGKSNARKALIRTAAGRFKTVKVGDRLDGGKVSAITETELRYQKNGRNIVLKLPRG
jgi:hypothetical protein